ncbi:unnamed protein product [Phyllotreta striolata]|uniref:Uncharacterized protein n=1 Tax=Phyllotreta striolata TaxID=444603 RepID=A0A9N9XL35_PHYSR|nr:unnamed protein product [Phyllotreta striolata]
MTVFFTYLFFLGLSQLCNGVERKGLRDVLDSSCTEAALPRIKNGVFVEIKTQKLKNLSNPYRVAEYKCSDGSRRHLFCSRRKWIGGKSLCRNETTMVQFPVYLGKCSEDQKIKCKNFCVLINGEPICSCPPGSKRVDNQCKDIKSEDRMQADAPDEYDDDEYDDDYDDDDDVEDNQINEGSTKPVKDISKNRNETYDETSDYDEDYDEDYDYVEKKLNTNKTILPSKEAGTEDTNNANKPHISMETIKQIIDEIRRNSNSSDNSIVIDYDEYDYDETTTKTPFTSTKKIDEINKNVNEVIEKTVYHNNQPNEEDYIDNTTENEKITTTLPAPSTTPIPFTNNDDISNNLSPINNFDTNPDSLDKIDSTDPFIIDLMTTMTATDDFQTSTRKIDDRITTDDNTPTTTETYNDYDTDIENIDRQENKCETGYTMNKRGECVDIDECQPETNPCSDICENTAGSYTCACPAGFRLNSADPHTCQDVDECEARPCSHLCRNTPGSFRCDCPEGLTLSDRQCLNRTCSQGRTRINGVVQCTCDRGFVLGADGRSCEDIDECVLEQNCDHSCRNVIGSYVCGCREGYKLERERYCVDIDECAGLSHGCDQSCENTPGSYKCKCDEGFEFANGKDVCVDIDECDPARDLAECNQICINYRGGYECACHSGFKLSPDDATCEDIDECRTDNANCSHVCENSRGSYACKCEENYVLEADNHTCRIVDPCLEENGGCSHECTNSNGLAVCGCPKGYVLEDKDCYLHDACLTNNGGCSHVCVNANNEARCECPDNYELVNRTSCAMMNLCAVDNGNCSHFCEFLGDGVNCTCPELFVLRNETHCVEENPCLRDNGGCSHVCTTDEDYNVVCSCPDQFYLVNSTTCESLDPCSRNNGDCSHICDASNARICSCPAGFRLKNDTHCEQFNPCSVNNGGCSDICENVFGNVKCSCPFNYRLDNNNNCVVVDPCYENNGGCSHFCEYLDEEIICSCPDRHDLINETTCVRINACLTNNGGCSHGCSVDNKNNARCSCPKGYELSERTCVPVNVCNQNNGGCSHICSSVEARVVCKCPPGYELLQKTCIKTNPCSVNNGGCSHVCNNRDGEAVCSCPPGHKLLGKICMDEDPCSANNGGCSHYCRNNGGKRECSCPAGYVLRPNKRICKEVNECRVNRGGCSHGCKNVPGSFQCTCPLGLRLDPAKNKTCTDVDECLENNGGCEMICRNFKGGFKCDCPEGYLLQRDKRSCRMSKTALCHIPVAPLNGVIRCWEDNDESSFVPTGTKCNIWCNEGYKLKGDSKITCNESGSWEGQEPRCLVATCPKLPSIQNGWYLPGVCNSGRTYIGESCSVYCRKGFAIREDVQKFTCDSNMNWKPLVRPEMLYNACTRVPDNVDIKCPENGQIDFVLPKGQRYMFTKIPRPETNVDWSFVTSQPSWGIGLETTLPAGRTEVRFTAASPTDFNSTSSCRVIINVLDKEAPYSMGCPQNIERRLNQGETTQHVYWKEPSFYDNVGVVNVYKTREPGSEFGSGLHHITYVASDEAGNRAFCHFSIDVRDDLDNNVQSNSIEQYSSATYTSHRTAGKYRAVLICPNNAENSNKYHYTNGNEGGCYWRHMKVTNPIESQIPRIYSESRLPAGVRHNRRILFKWSR